MGRVRPHEQGKPSRGIERRIFEHGEHRHARKLVWVPQRQPARPKHVHGKLDIWQVCLKEITGEHVDGVGPVAAYAEVVCRRPKSKHAAPSHKAPPPPNLLQLAPLPTPHS